MKLQSRKVYEITTSPPQSGIKRTPRELTPAESHRFAPGSTTPAFSVKARFTRSLPGHGAHTRTTGRKRLVAPQRPEKTPDAVPPRPTVRRTHQRITSRGWGFGVLWRFVGTGQNQPGGIGLLSTCRHAAGRICSVCRAHYGSIFVS